MTTIKEVLQDLRAGFYVIPEIQRPFVWRNSQILDLTRSIQDSFPIGSIIYWEMPNEFVKEYGHLVRTMTDTLSVESGKYLVIDGQQRLTSLLLINEGSLKIDERDRKLSLFYNPEKEEYSLERRKELEDPAGWYNVTDIMKTETIPELLEKKAQQSGDDTINKNVVTLKKLTALKNGIDTYDLNLYKAKFGYYGDFLELFEKISNVFVLLNSKGTRIRLPDLIIALLTGRTQRVLGKSFRNTFKSLMNELDISGWQFNETVIIRLYMAISTGVSQFASAKTELSRIAPGRIEKFLELTKETITNTLQILEHDVGVKNEEQLQSGYLLVPMAYYVYRNFISQKATIPEAIKREMTRWFILASLEGRFTGKLEGDLGEDVKAISADKGTIGLLQNLRSKSLSNYAMDGDYNRARLACLLFLYNKNEASDWDQTSSTIASKVRALKTHNIHVHHIFSRRALSESYEGENSIDDIANITIISGPANESISDKLPKVYLAELDKTDSELLKRHYVPRNKNLWKIESYDAFLTERRASLYASLEKMLKL